MTYGCECETIDHTFIYDIESKKLENFEKCCWWRTEKIIQL